jgi:hypothetical protein
MTQTVKHGIFIVSLVASLGMLLFSHYAYAFNETSFGGVLQYEYRPPFYCSGQYGPFQVDPYPNTNEPTGFGEISSNSDHVTGKIQDGVQILGLLSNTPSSNCYIQLGPYQYQIQTTIFSYFGTSNLPSYGF